MKPDARHFSTVPTTPSADRIEIGTYNLKNYHYPGRPHDPRYELVEQVVRELVPPHPTVLALQELPGDDWTSAACGLQRLAEATGLHCHVLINGRAVAAAVPGGHDRLGFGLLWTGDIEPVANSLYVLSGQSLWHALIMLGFAVDGYRFTVGSYHAPPRRGLAARVTEAHTVSHALLTHGLGDFWLGADFNTVSARRGGDGRYYDPDPAESLTADERRGWGANLPEVGYATDRRPDEIFAEARFADVAIEADAPWRPTTGHWPGERNGRRRLDRVLWHPGTTGSDPDALRPRVIAYTVHDTPEAHVASDHLPVSVTVRRPHGAAR